MDYTTQMDAARKGIITKELQAVAEKEQMDTARLMQLVAEGKVAIPANKNHKCLDPNGIGSMLKTKINVNLGTSRDCKDLDMELQKVNDAVKMDPPLDTMFIRRLFCLKRWAVERLMPMWMVIKSTPSCACISTIFNHSSVVMSFSAL